MTNGKAVAVIIGAASGIGRALAAECKKNGYELALADLDSEKLSAAAKGISDTGYFAALDVADYDAVQRFADNVFARYDRVGILINSAGIFAASSIFEQDIEHWKWVMDVNFGGVLNSVKAFAPQMAKTNDQSYIVNVASIMGLLSAPKTASYCASKHAVVTFSESLQMECQMMGANIAVSVVCPGAVATDILDIDRYEKHTDRSPQAQRTLDKIIEASDVAPMSPEEHARIVFEDMLAGKFWILPHKDMFGQIEIRTQGILAETGPSFIPRNDAAKKGAVK